MEGWVKDGRGRLKWGRGRMLSKSKSLKRIGIKLILRYNKIREINIF